jgi:hypothetical protein
LKLLLFVILYLSDLVVLKGILKLPLRLIIKVWAVTTLITVLIATVIIFKAPITYPEVSNTFAFRSMQAAIYGAFDFLMRTFFMGILFKIRLNSVQLGLFLGLCLAINFAHVFLQVYTVR